MLRFGIRLAFFILLALLVEESVMHTILEPGNFPVSHQEDIYKVFILDPIPTRDGVYKFGRMNEYQARWHVNNVGWNSNTDYAAKEKQKKKVVAVFGDSYVGGYQVDVSQKFDAYLQ